jgi:hypothetical protein
VSEIGDLIAILGEVDLALGGPRDPRRADVRALVPPYRRSDEFRWYDGFLEATETEPERMPSLDEAMDNLAQPTRFPSMLPRRLLAIALAARVFPQFGPGGESEDVSLRALTIPGIFPGPPLPTPPSDEPPDHPGLDDLRARAHDLLELLTDRDELPDIEHWHEFLERHPELISAQLASTGDLCSTSVIERPGPGGAGAIAVLETRLCIDGVSVSDLAGRFLRPASWPDCSQWWCSMTVAPARPPLQGIDRYLEVVAVDCPSDLLKVAVFLDFATPVNATTRAVLVYRLSTDQSGMAGGVSANGGVDVDSGTIEVVAEGNHVRVATTKRVRFTGLDTKTIAVIACWVGYGDNATDLIFSCAGGPAKALDCDQEARTAGEAHKVEVGSPWTAAVDGWVALARSCADEAGTHARAVAAMLDTGSYAPDTAASDAAKTGALVARSWAKVATQSLAAVRAITRPPRLADLTSRPFALAAVASEDCELALEQPLRSPFNDEIAARDVAIVPSVLRSGEHTFRLAIHSAEVKGSYYTGIVVAKTLTAPHEIGRVPVDVIVP